MDSRRRTPSERSLRTSDRIDQAVLRSIARQGVDLTSMKSASEEAQISIGPLYARFESIDDLVAHLYERSIGAHLETLLENLGLSIFTGDETAKAWVAREMAKPSTESQVLVEFLAVARRYPFLGEVIRLHLTTILNDYLASSPAPASTSFVSINIVLGYLFLLPILSKQDKELTGDLIDFMASLVLNSDCWNEPPSQATPLHAELPTIDLGPDESFMGDIVTAVIKVIAQVGFEKATANRISRAAGRDFANTYHAFESKDELMETVTSAYIPQMTALSLAPFFGIPRDQYLVRSAINGASLAAEINRQHRQLRLEAIVAARHRRPLTLAMRREFSKSDTTLMELINQHLGGATDEQCHQARLMWLAIRANSIGISMLASNTSLLEPIDWVAASSALYAELANRGFVAT